MKISIESADKKVEDRNIEKFSCAEKDYSSDPAKHRCKTSLANLRTLYS
jgi:hypothetical protein